MTILPFDDAEFIWGAAGVPGTGVSAGEKASIQTRLTALEARPNISTLGSNTDTAFGTLVAGDLVTWDAGTSKWKNVQPAARTFTVGIPFVIDGGGAAITAGVKYTGIEVPFTGTITGWSIYSTVSGTIACTVSKATYAALPTYTAISGTEKPSLAAAQKNQDLALTTWTTAVTAGDFLQISVDALATSVVYATVSIRISRTI